MSLIKKAVLLLKAEKSEGTSDKYEDLLRLDNFEKLKRNLMNADQFSGLIFSSPRCVNAAAQALNKDEVEKLWGHKRNFAVGETTRKEALDKLGLTCAGQESGNAKNLAQVIIGEKTKDLNPFLFPHGNLKTDTLKLELGKENLKLVEVLVYDTIPNPDIEQDLSRSTNGFATIPEFVVFFSPSGLHSSLNYLRRVPIDFNLLKFIAIGPVTQLAIEEQNLKVYKVAKSPTPDEVLKTLTISECEVLV